MNKIPIKIVIITTPSGEIIKEVMLDVFDYYNIAGSVDKKLQNFRKKYFEIVDKAKKIMPEEKSKRKSSHFWQIGKLLSDFNKTINNEFEITNYHQAIIRDFGLYNRSVVGHTLQFGEFFKKNEVTDSIPISHYIELIWKANMLRELGLFEKEKKRLLDMAKKDSLPPHKEYREELNRLTKSVKKKVMKH